MDEVEPGVAPEPALVELVLVDALLVELVMLVDPVVAELVVEVYSKQNRSCNVE